jgi:cell division protein FtsI (penicillin-binding protein 3)
MPSSPPRRRRTIDLMDKRVGLLFGLFAMLLLVGVARAAYLGTFRSGALSAAASEEHIQTVPVPAERGEITDRSGDPLAISENTDEIVADPILIAKGDPTRAAKQLSPLLHISQQKLLTEITKPGSGYVVLTNQTPSATTQKVIALDINGINDLPTTRREYPNGSLASSVLGWVNQSGAGISGLEAYFNKQLSGKSGSRRIVNDAMGRPISVANTKTMVPGKSIKLTLSVPLESEVQKVLGWVAKTEHPLGATAIVTDPQTDQVLAIDNWPTMNSNNITTADVHGSDGRLPSADDMAVDFDYEPGSTFKPVTVSGALQDGLITPSTVIDVPPYLTVYGTQIHDAESHGYEPWTPGDILKYSSNIGADLIGQKLGINRFYGWVTKFGFGHDTGVSLFDENQGLVQPKSQFHTDGTLMYNAPFGQGESVTPIQMVQMYDAIADGGVLRTPQVVETIGGAKVAEPKGHRIISTHTASEVRGMLRSVLTDGGTAAGDAIPGYDIAGKTGTANVEINGSYSSSQYVASFIGMVPASAPKLLVAVVVDRPQNGDIYGGTAAGPAFQKIVGWAVPRLGIDPCPNPCPKTVWAAPSADGL